MLCALDHRFVIYVKALRINETLSAGESPHQFQRLKEKRHTTRLYCGTWKCESFPTSSSEKKKELSFIFFSLVETYFTWLKKKQSPNSSYRAVSEDGGIRSKRSEGDAGQPTEE